MSIPWLGWVVGGSVSWTTDTVDTRAAHSKRILYVFGITSFSRSPCDKIVFKSFSNFVQRGCSAPLLHGTIKLCSLRYTYVCVWVCVCVCVYNMGKADAQHGRNNENLSIPRAVALPYNILLYRTHPDGAVYSAFLLDRAIFFSPLRSRVYCVVQYTYFVPLFETIPKRISAPISRSVRACASVRVLSSIV